MNAPDLNLARKWRSKNFDQVIGQDLCVRILKNALYLNSFFPVYLFSGQRGCGKTTMARLFAAAANCDQLESFQKDPKNFSVPCLKCISCSSMALGKHPDFIEIDAASHTGVDNVRQIIEASSLLPLMGKKKIYLIDEAHMLSKAAFNAFLKILEEPPASVLFILATTDVQKIIDTVRSRSFQLFFSAVSNDTLLLHLENICKQENIDYDVDGLKLIVNESSGSVRDAINLLEQVRFANSKVTKNIVLQSLGHLSDDNLLQFFDYLVNKKDPAEFLTFLDKINYFSLSAESIWDGLTGLLRDSLRIKYGVNSRLFEDQQVKLAKILANCPLSNVIFLLDEFCKNELIFNKSINKNLFLELICLRNLRQPTKEINTTVAPIKEIKNSIPMPTVEIKEEIVDLKSLSGWDGFLSEFKQVNDPLMSSVFGQAKFISHDESSGEVIILFPKAVIFYKDLIDDKINIWSPILKKNFSSKATLKINFDVQVVEEKIKENKPKVQSVQAKAAETKNESVDISDKDKWKLANDLLKTFSGTITEIREETNE